MVKQNKFIIILPMYNVGEWIGLALHTLRLQTYSNFFCVLLDDASIDDTYSIAHQAIQGDKRFELIQNSIRTGSQLGNGLKCLDHCKLDGEEIVIFHDGDDWLTSTYVLDYLDKIYSFYDCWMTYGNWINYPHQETGDHMLIPIPDEVDNRIDGYRSFPFIFTHLRTSKAFLWKALNREDLRDPSTGEFFNSASDVAVQLPFIEMCRKEKAYCINEPLLSLNRSNVENVANSRLSEQKKNESYIRSLKPYTKYEFIK